MKKQLSLVLYAFLTLQSTNIFASMMLPPSPESTLVLALNSFDKFSERAICIKEELVGLKEVMEKRAYYYAVVKKCFEQKNVNPNICSQNGNTALSIAANVGYEPFIDQLLANHLVDVNHQNKSGLSPLMLALMQGDRNIHVIKKLLDNKRLKVDLQDKCGQTALMYALNYLTDTPYTSEKNNYNSYIEYVFFKLILDRGAATWLETIDGLTALDYAKHHTSSLLKKLLASEIKRTKPHENLFGTQPADQKAKMKLIEAKNKELRQAELHQQNNDHDNSTTPPCEYSDSDE